MDVVAIADHVIVQYSSVFITDVGFCCVLCFREPMGSCEASFMVFRGDRFRFSS